MKTPKNTHKVAPVLWRKWERYQRSLYNLMFESTVADQSIFLHPKTKPLPVEQWNTICHNVACQAVWSAERA